MNINLPKDFIIFANKVANKNNCEILSITFNKEKKSNILRITIDGKDTSLNICSSISRNLSRWLDRHEDEIKSSSYILEVTSPGADKKLINTEDFIKSIDKLVYFETKTKALDGRKRYKGRVKSCKNGIVHIYVEEESAEFDIAIKDIAKAHIEYEL